MKVCGIRHCGRYGSEDVGDPIWQYIHVAVAVWWSPSSFGEQLAGTPDCCHVAVAGPGGVQQVHVPPGMLSTLLGIKLVIGLPRSLFNRMLKSTAVCESAGTVIKSGLLPP